MLENETFTFFANEHKTELAVHVNSKRKRVICTKWSTVINHYTVNRENSMGEKFCVGQFAKNPAGSFTVTLAMLFIRKLSCF